MKKEELKEAKRKLYSLLLEKSNEEELTDVEIDIMFYLAKDKDIQKILEFNN